MLLERVDRLVDQRHAIGEKEHAAWPNGSASAGSMRAITVRVLPAPVP